MEVYCFPCDNHGLKTRTIRTPEYIVAAACEYFHLDEKVLLGRMRAREIVDKRHMVMTYLRFEKHVLLRVIGSVLSKNHATVISGLRNMDNLCTTNPDFKQEYLNLVKYLNEA